MHVPLYDVRALVALVRFLLPEKDKGTYSWQESRIHTSFGSVQPTQYETVTRGPVLTFWTRFARSLSTSDNPEIQPCLPWNCHVAMSANVWAGSHIREGVDNGSLLPTPETAPRQCQAPSQPSLKHASRPSLPVDKLACPLGSQTRQQVVLVAPGSFNPPTHMHLRMMELAREALTDHGYAVLGGYLSPVNDAYGKKGLAAADHRIAMCHLAVRDSPFLMVDTWEVHTTASPAAAHTEAPTNASRSLNPLSLAVQASQPAYQRTLTVVRRVEEEVNAALQAPGTERVRVVLVCGADVLHSFAMPGVWIPEQVEELVREFGVVCVSRNGSNSRLTVNSDDLLFKHRKSIEVVDEWVANDISSSKLRQMVRRGRSILYLTPLEVVRYIEENKLYK